MIRFQPLTCARQAADADKAVHERSKPRWRRTHRWRTRRARSHGRRRPRHPRRRLRLPAAPRLSGRDRRRRQGDGTALGPRPGRSRGARRHAAGRGRPGHLPQAGPARRARRSSCSRPWARRPTASSAWSSGADDYLPKPCNPRELLARVRAVLRRRREPRGRRAASDAACEFAGWRLDLVRRELRSPEGVVVNLSSGEFSLLRAFVERPQRVLTPRPAAGSRPRPAVRRLRPRHRRADQPPAPQARRRRRRARS